MMYDIDNLPVYIDLGQLSEKGAKEIEFDVTEWLTAFPTGTFSISYIRPTETTVYPVAAGDISTATALGITTLTWAISDTVTAIAGAGSMVVQLAVADTVVKRSRLVQTIVQEGHSSAGDPPEPVADWIADATSKLDETIAATEAANEAAGLATDAISRANEISETMEGIAPLWSDVDISVSTLGEGAAPTASITQGETGTSISLGIPKGDTGAQGIQGEKGDTGPSAYDAAFAGGYKGTEAEFNAANAGIEAAKDAALDAAETANEAAENAETAAYRSMLWRKTATGNPVSVYPAPESPLYLKVSGTFTQEGTGDPSPENIRPISQWVAQGDAVRLRRTGRNLASRPVDFPSGTMTVTKNGVTWTLQDDGTIVANGTSTSISQVAVFATNIRGRLPKGTYTFAAAPQDKLSTVIRGVIGVYHSTEGIKEYSEHAVVEKTFEITEDWQEIYFYCRIAAGVTASNVVFKPQLELGATATPYEPYSGQEITLTAPQDIWGGWMDNEGNGQATWGKLVLNGTEVWAFGGEAEGVKRYTLGGTGAKLSAMGSCSHAINSTTATVLNNFWFSAGTAGLMAMTHISADATEFRAYLAAQYAAGTPVTIFYELATPIPLTPATAPLTALPQIDRITPRQNVLTASTGKVELTYAKSPIQESNEIRAAIALI